MIDILLKFTTSNFELLRSANQDKDFLGEAYDGMDTMIENYGNHFMSFIC